MTDHATATGEQWLDRMPDGRNKGDLSWFRRHDRYQASYR